MKGELIPFKSKGPKIRDKENIVDHGQIGDLSYEVYARGVVHIFDKKLRFKKDCTLFDQELDELDFEKLKEGQEYLITGSGDNDDLTFKKENGDIKIILKVKEFEIINKLKNILGMRKNKKAI